MKLVAQTLHADSAPSPNIASKRLLVCIAVPRGAKAGILQFRFGARLLQQARARLLQSHEDDDEEEKDEDEKNQEKQEDSI